LQGGVQENPGECKLWTAKKKKKKGTLSSSGRGYSEKREINPKALLGGADKKAS